MSEQDSESFQRLEHLIDKLAIGVGKGFEDVQERLADVKSDVDASFAHLHTIVERIDQRLERVEFLVTGQEQRLSIAEDRIRQLATKVGYQFN